VAKNIYKSRALDFLRRVWYGCYYNKINEATGAVFLIESSSGEKGKDGERN
jgi:hypothetical protein